MTTNEKISTLIVRLTYKASRFIWSDVNGQGWATDLPQNNRIHIHHNCTIRITDWTGADIIPPEDLNQTCNMALRFELAQTVSHLCSDRGAIIDAVIAELEKVVSTV